MEAWNQSELGEGEGEGEGIISWTHYDSPN